MKCYASICGILLLALALFGCGGGNGSPTPDNTNGGGDAEHPVFTAQGPDRVSGDHSVSTVPDQLNILTGASGAELAAIVDKYGCSVLSQSHGWATIQLPAGTDPTTMAATLEKEYNIAKAEPVHRINTPLETYASASVKGSSWMPYAPMYADFFIALAGVDTTSAPPDVLPVYNTFIGQGQPMNDMGFTGAWDVVLDDAVLADATRVRVAIVDAGFLDYLVTDRPGLNEGILDATNSAQIASDGTATTGLPAVTWDLWDADGDPNTIDVPRRDVGERMLGILAADINSYIPQAVDVDQMGTPDGIQPDEVWNEGIAGINPTATYILIKTGELNGDNWSFTDNHIAESIDYLMGLPEADRPNIILLGMFGNGVVAANISAAIQNARDNNVLVIAPAGDIIDSAQFDTGTGAFTGWGSSPVDIRLSPVTPASDPNVVSVSGTGFDRIGTLPDVDFGDGPIANDARGWHPKFGPPFDQSFDQIANYCNVGGSIAAVSYAIGFGFHPILVAGGTPPTGLPGETFTSTFASFGTAHAAAYVAGAASVVWQGLHAANGTPPTDDEVLAELLATVSFRDMAGLPAGSGLLNAGFAAFSGLKGGDLQEILPAMTVESAILSQPLAAVTRGTDLSLTTTVVDGTAPFKAEIDWGDGPITVDPWTNGDPVTLTGGYDTLGMKAVNMTITDANNVSVNVGFALFVINPLGMGITISDVTGNTLGGNPVALDGGTQYRFNANPTNMFTGDIGGVQNDVAFSWDFGDGTAAATGVSPVHGYQNAGDFTLLLTVTETVRPDTQWSVDVTVN